MLHRYERGWHYRGVLTELSGEEAEFVRALCRRYGSWIDMSFELEYHQKVLAVLSRLNVEFLEACFAYFGGGTLLTLKYDEYRVSRDIDFLCSSQQGYRRLRQEIFVQGYNAVFADQSGISLPRDIQSDSYGVRFPAIVDDVSIKFEIIREGRIKLELPDHLDSLPVACLSPDDCFAEKLLANSDRWLDASVESRDLIDLAILRSHSAIPEAAIAKAESAYPVVEPLKRAIANFQAKPDYRERCYGSLKVRSPKTIVDGLDLLAFDFGLPTTERASVEQ